MFHSNFKEHKLPPGQNPDEWTIREKLTLASSVVRSGDQNWYGNDRTLDFFMTSDHIRIPVVNRKHICSKVE